MTTPKRRILSFVFTVLCLKKSLLIRISLIMSKIERSEDLFSRKPYFESCRILHFSVNDLRWWYIIFSKIQLKMERSDTGLWLERSDSLPLHRHKLNMSELIDSNVDLFMYLIEGLGSVMESSTFELSLTPPQEQNLTSPTYRKQKWRS